MSIGDKQIRLINSANNFLKDLKLSNIDLSLSSFCYFTTWSKTPGYVKLKYWLYGWSFALSYCIILFKNILAIASHAKYIEIKKQNFFKKYDILVISWAFKKNFQADGSYHDRYFDENSKDLPNSHWILISMDGYIPKNLNENITLLKKKEGIFKYHFFSFIKILITTIFDCRFSPRKIYHYLFLPSYFAKIVSRVVIKEIKKNGCKAILLPYEGQPFQNNVFLNAKKFNKKIVTIGYLHSLLTPLPCELIYRSGAPDLLLVHGESQIKILQTILNWPKSKLLLIDSLRFRLNDSNSLSNKIFLPMIILNANLYIDEFKKLLVNSPVNYFSRFDIKNHPVMMNSKKHLYLKRELENIMDLYNNRFTNTSSNKNISIFFGITATIFEALEKGLNVIHICSDPVFESHSEKIWPNLKVKQISKFIFDYKLVLQGKYIAFGKKGKVLNKIVKNAILI